VVLPRPARWPRRTRRRCARSRCCATDSPFNRRGHEVEGKTARLWLCASAGSGYLEVPSEQIAGFEPGPSTVPEERASAPGTGGSGSHPARESIGPMIVSAASRHQIDPDFLASVVKAESGFNAAAVSPKGARGLNAAHCRRRRPRWASRIRSTRPRTWRPERSTSVSCWDRYHGDAIQAAGGLQRGGRGEWSGLAAFPKQRGRLPATSPGSSKISTQGSPATSAVGRGGRRSVTGRNRTWRSGCGRGRPPSGMPAWLRNCGRCAHLRPLLVHLDQLLADVC